MIEHLTQPSPAELDALTALWEASVRATHDFLSEEDIPFFRQMVRNEALAAVDLYVIRDTDDRTDRACGSGGTDGTDGADGNRGSTAASPTGETGRDSRANEFGGFTAFAGVAGDMLEMLFVAPGARGKGFGRQLVNHVTRHCGVRRVDVNEQNPQAAGFYERMGFRTAGRDAYGTRTRPAHRARADSEPADRPNRHRLPGRSARHGYGKAALTESAVRQARFLRLHPRPSYLRQG